MEWSLGFFAIAALAVLFAAVSKGGFGSGVSFAGAALLALILEPAVALGVMMPALLVMDAVALRPFWNRWDWGETRGLLLGAVPGVMLGIALWRIADADMLRLLIGAVALGFVLLQAAQWLGVLQLRGRVLPSWAGWATGCAAGFTSFVAHAGGPAVTAYLLTRGLSKTAFQATTVLLFGAINVLKLPAYVALGTITWDTAAVALALTPFAVAGVWLGVWLHRAVSARLFFALSYLFLAAAGVKLVLDAVT